ncbi:MAG: hypothetical protein K2X87_33085 [Gemmataceae bacterium]|nr:hypothetical protein [Gemmataceae bacterium]
MNPDLPDWRRLARMPEADLAGLDVAAVNLACAAGHPGADAIDVPGCLRWLDGAADLVRRWTAAGLDEFFHPNPAEYNHSEAYFRVLALTTVLQRHCGVRYDSSKIGAGPEEPFELHEQFIHGAIQGPGGTCATLPVVYAAVGRRLGYPVRLACAKRHLFARWDDPAAGERFNIEASGRGFDDPPDDHYRRWPLPIDGPEEERAFGYLESFSPRREAANAVAQRAFVLLDLRRHREAVECFADAAEVTPEYATYPLCLDAALARWDANLLDRRPPGFPQVEGSLRRDRRRWPRVPWPVERRIAATHAAEWCLDHPDHERWWWGPLRRGEPPAGGVPASIEVDYDMLRRMLANPN